MSRQKMIAAPPDISGTPMERFEKILKRVIAAPKETVDERARNRAQATRMAKRKHK